MTVIYLTQHNTKCYGVPIQNNGNVKVQKFKDISDDENNIYYVKPLDLFMGESEICDMTEMSGALDKSVFNGNTILLKISEENNKHRYVYIGGNMVCTFLTNDKIDKYISNKGNNLTSYSNALGDEK